MNPERRRLRRGETVETCSPATEQEGGPRSRGRPLGRCHTLDPGEETPAPPAGHDPQESEPDQTDATPPHQQPHVDDANSSLEAGSAHPDSSPTPATADTPASPRPPEVHAADEHAADLCPLEGATDVLWEQEGERCATEPAERQQRHNNSGGKVSLLWRTEAKLEANLTLELERRKSFPSAF